MKSLLKEAEMTKRQQNEVRRLERQLWEEHRTVLEVPPGLPNELKLKLLRSVFRDLLPSTDFQVQRRRHPEKTVHVHFCTGFCPACTYQPYCSPEKMATEKARLAEALAEAFGVPMEPQPGELRGHWGSA
jgi:hypothetical protein